MAEDRDKKRPRSFEPPPWEREQFEELARRREQEARLREERTRAEAEAEEAMRRVAAQASTAAEERQPAAEGGTEAVPGAETSVVPTGGDDPAKRLLFQLQAEEREQYGGSIWRFGIAAAVLLAVIGCGMLAISVRAAARTTESGMAGLVGSAIIGIVGTLILGIAVWQGVRSYEKRGEL